MRLVNFINSLLRGHPNQSVPHPTRQVNLVSRGQMSYVRIVVACGELKCGITPRKLLVSLRPESQPHDPISTHFDDALPPELDLVRPHPAVDLRLRRSIRLSAIGFRGSLQSQDRVCAYAGPVSGRPKLTMKVFGLRSHGRTIGIQVELAEIGVTDERSRQVVWNL